MDERENLTIIDGKSVFYRGYYAMGHLSLPDGTPTGGVYGFASMLIEIIEKLKPEYIAVAWDKSKTNIRSRRAIYADYKANRKPAPPDFYAQIPYLMELLEAFHIPLYEFDDYEADDIIGTLAKKAQAADKRVEIISGDLEMLQIVDDHIKMYQLKRGFSDVAEFNIPDVEAKYGLKKDQFLDLKAIKGDSSDNIPGVPGIGEKGAVKLLQEYGTLENLYDHIDEVQGAVGKKLQFNSLIRKFIKIFPETKLENVAKITTEAQKSTSNPVVKKTTSKSDQIPTDILPPPVDIKVEIPENLYISHNVKADMHDNPDLAAEILAGRQFWDLGQVDFLLDPLARKTDQMSLVDLGDPKEDYIKQRKQLAAMPSLEKIATEFDMPLIPVLYQMEKEGVAIAPERFNALRKEFSTELSELEQKIYTISGKNFNINSPIQLSQVLFEDLGLPTQGIKKTQRAYSTGAKELDKLRNQHEIIPLIERYREVGKLLSTYINPLPTLADENHRIHTTYTQDVTATGRLSSVNPNLQNIPVRSDDGKRIRNCFVAEAGKIFVSADYAQFELRLAAALSGDQKLINDFNANLDIHTKTAADAFHIPMEEVTKNQRRAAKVINFGVLYGMSPKGLSDTTGMSFYEAKQFIDRYFELRAPIRKYLDNTLEFGRTNGYVETMFGRRRPTPDLGAPNHLVRTAAERAAGNMPIQGTEADLMKKAMLAVSKKLPNGAKLILQVHDSMIIECNENQAENIKTILQETMENIAPDLPVKLTVDVTTGYNWGEL